MACELKETSGRGVGLVQIHQDHTKCEVSSAFNIQQELVSGMPVNVSVVCLNLWMQTQAVTSDCVEWLDLDLTPATNASSLRSKEAAFHPLLATELGTVLGLQYCPQPRPEASQPVVCSA